MSRRDLLAYLQDFAWREVAITAAPTPAVAAAQTRAEPAAAPAAAVGEDPLAAADLAGMGRALAGCRR